MGAGAISTKRLLKENALLIFLSKYRGEHVVDNQNHYFSLGLIPKPKRRLAVTFGDRGRP